MAAVVSPGYLFYLIILSVSIVIGLKDFRRLAPSYKTLVYLLVIVLISQLASTIVVKYKMSNHFVFHALIPFQSIFYGYIFSGLIRAKTGRSSKIPVYTGYFYALVSITISLLSAIDGIDFPSLNISLLSILMISSSLLLFYHLINNPSEQALMTQSEFWYATANLVFFAGSFLIFGLYDWMLVQGRHLPPWGSKAIYLLNYFLYGGYLISIYLDAHNNRQGK